MKPSLFFQTHGQMASPPLERNVQGWGERPVLLKGRALHGALRMQPRVVGAEA